MADAQEIVARAFDNLYGYSSVQQIAIQSDGGLAVRSKIAHRAGELHALLGRSISPARGNGLLIVEGPEHAYTTRVYIAAFRTERGYAWERTDPVPSTDLWFEDFLPKRARDWNASSLEEGVHEGRDAWRVRLEPNGVPSAYERADYWLDQELPVALAADFYRGGEKVRTLTVDPDRVEHVDEHFVPTRLVFRGATETTVEISDVEIRELKDSLFRTNALRRENLP
jgi:hypothetical protein